MTNQVLTTRVLPPLRRPGTRAHLLVERNLRVYRRTWMILLSGFFEPVFYLFSVGVGVGSLVGEIPLADGRTVSYAAFVAPALLAASAMNGAIYESTLNIFFKLRYGKIYDGILATPLQPGDIALGEIAWSLIRGGLYATGFMIVMAIFGLMESPLGILAVPAALLIGLAFGGVGMAATTFMKSWQDFDLIALATMPLFLFSATFYPLEIYPPLIQQITRISPLYHGAELIRGLTLGVLDSTMVGHAAFLIVLGSVGMLVASRRITKLLMQ
jgi:lipooligosaccharide transport system permease protein